MKTFIFFLKKEIKYTNVQIFKLKNAIACQHLFSILSGTAYELCILRSRKAEETGKHFLMFFLSPNLIMLMVFRKRRNFYRLSPSIIHQSV